LTLAEVPATSALTVREVGLALSDFDNITVWIAHVADWHKNPSDTSTALLFATVVVVGLSLQGGSRSDLRESGRNTVETGFNFVVGLAALQAAKDPETQGGSAPPLSAFPRLAPACGRYGTSGCIGAVGPQFRHGHGDRLLSPPHGAGQRGGQSVG